MKKTACMLLLITGFSSYLFGQEAPTPTPTVTYKAVAKSFTAEVNFNPISSSPISINYLRFRKFVTDKTAYRLGFSVSAANQTDIESVVQSTFELSLRPGYEVHFEGTERLSPYIGFDVDLSIKSSKFTDDRTSSQRGPYSVIKGAWDANGTERGFTRFGGNIIIGADYYIVKKLYLGLEIGYGLQVVNASKISLTTRTPPSPPSIKGGSTFQVGPNFNSALRLGFIF